MLVEFTIKNFKCFKEEVKFSLIASNYDKETRIEDNTFYIEKFNIRLLKSAVLYGANASGKTKFIDAIGFLRYFIFESSDGQAQDSIGIDSYKLSPETENSPTTFEIIFIHNEELFRYGFEIDQEKVHAEWLYHRPKTKEIELFYRENQDFELHKTRFKVKDLVEHDRIRKNALLLSVAAQFNDATAKNILAWFKRLNVISGISDFGYEDYTIKMMLHSDDNRQHILEFLQKADLGISDIKIEIDEKGQLGELTTLHKSYNKQGVEVEPIEFPLRNESQGTRKYFALSALILRILMEGDILFVDELANKFHPNLTCHLIKLFNSKVTNPNNAQLVFNTHDTNLLSSGLFRRDQIWFAEKDRYGAATLYALSDIKKGKARRNDNFEKNYIQGKYGAVPYLGDFDKLFETPKAATHENEK